MRRDNHAWRERSKFLLFLAYSGLLVAVVVSPDQQQRVKSGKYYLLLFIIKLLINNKYNLFYNKILLLFASHK